MNRRNLGLGLVVTGVVLIAVGVIVALSGSPETETAAPQTTSTSAAATSTSTSAATTTTSTVPTTTTVPPATTTSLPAEAIDEFVTLFATALENGDQAFVMDRLHPDVVDGFTFDVCETWVQGEIMALSGYGLIGEVTGPVDKSVTIAGQSVTIPAVYSAPVRFTFNGRDFDSSADFALIDGVVHWLGACE